MVYHYSHSASLQPVLFEQWLNAMSYLKHFKGSGLSNPFSSSELGTLACFISQTKKERQTEAASSWTCLVTSGLTACTERADALFSWYSSGKVISEALLFLRLVGVVSVPHCLSLGSQHAGDGDVWILMESISWPVLSHLNFILNWHIIIIQIYRWWLIFWFLNLKSGQFNEHIFSLYFLWFYMLCLLYW
jgi:hypothetical protein